MSWVLLSLGVYTFVYCVVLLFLENFSGGMLFGMDKQVIAALIGAGVSVAAILGSIIKDRISEKGEHDALKEQINNEHAGIGKQITSEHTILTNQIQAEHASLENSFRRHEQGSTIFMMSQSGWKVCGRMWKNKGSMFQQ